MTRIKTRLAKHAPDQLGMAFRASVVLSLGLVFVFSPGSQCCRSGSIGSLIAYPLASAEDDHESPDHDADGEHGHDGDVGDVGRVEGGSDAGDQSDKSDHNEANDVDAPTVSDSDEGKEQDEEKSFAEKEGKKNKKANRPASAANSTSNSSRDGPYKGGQVVAVGLSSADMTAVNAMGFRVATPTLLAAGDTPAVVELLVPDGTDEVSARAALAKALPGRQFGLNKIYTGYGTATSSKASAVKNRNGPPGADPRCRGDQCYGRDMIGWQSGLETCSAGVSIGMIDTAIDIDNSAFSGSALVTKSFQPAAASEESSAHATGVAALLTGNGSAGAPGLLPKARLIAADVFYVDDQKHVVTDTASLVRALEWLDAAGVGVINMSFSGPQDDLVAGMIKAMSEKGVAFVAAAGNNGPGATEAYPAAYEEVIAVTAVDSSMRSYVEANHGSYIDVAAPGVRIWTALAGSKSGYQSGTSFAVPYVTASLAASAVYGDPWAATRWLEETQLDDLGSPGADNVFGRGLLRAPPRCGSNSPAVGDAFLSAVLPGRQ